VLVGFGCLSFFSFFLYCMFSLYRFLLVVSNVMGVPGRFLIQELIWILFDVLFVLPFEGILFFLFFFFLW